MESELLACLFGKDNRSFVKEKLRKSFENSDKTVDLLVAAIGYILRDLQKKKTMSQSDLFHQLFKIDEKYHYIT